MYFPDYYGIEIKTTSRFSDYPLNLFSISFDGPNLFETNRILQKYGKVDYKYKNRKILMGYLNSNYPVKLTNYSFKLETNYLDRKLYLCVYDENNNLIERNSFVCFDTILERFKVKLNNLVVVYASKKKVDGNLYYRYYAYKSYILRDDIDIFELLNKNILKVMIECRVSRSGAEEGRQRNKSLVFRIDKDKLKYLFKCIDIYNFDKVSNNFNIVSI